MTIIRKLFLDGEKSNNFYNEQLELYRQHVSSKVRESVGPIQDATIRELKQTLEKLHGDSKMEHICLLLSLISMMSKERR